MTHDTKSHDDKAAQPESPSAAVEVKDARDNIVHVAPEPPRADRGTVIVSGSVPAQVRGADPVAPGHVPVKESHRHTDVVITDTSHPLAVQPLPPRDDLPQLSDARTPEEKLTAGE